jgi:formylglycine-generating enzyme required for sulfatase activity
MSLHLDVGAEPIPGYRLIRLLGRGGFGEVWEAIAPGDFHVALKFLRLETSEAGAEQKSLEVIRNIRHVHLLDVQFATRVSDCLVIAMPLCDQTLLDRLRACQAEGRPGVPRNELLRYMNQLADAVDYLNEPRHRAGDGRLVGVQHRDIKPQNIFLVGDSVRLADFGLAKILAATAASTQGAMSPHYAAPEVIQGTFSRWSDQYSLAATYFELRTGRPPFTGEHALQIIFAQVHTPPDLSGFPESERPVLARALAKRPEDRWPSCRAFVQQLEEAEQAGVNGGAVMMRETTPVLPETVPRLCREPEAPAEQVSESLTNAIGMTLVPIPAGEFLMGSSDMDPDAEVDERPYQRVQISRRFYLGAHEVTQAQYREMMEQEPSWFSASGGGRAEVTGQDTDQHPVEQVSWYEAVAFCNLLSEREGMRPYYRMTGAVVAILGGDGYRLPTEAEWEFACRAGSSKRYLFGDEIGQLDQYAWYADNSGNQTHPVGLKRPNRFGLYDMHGNVWEWCWDWYDSRYYSELHVQDPSGPYRGTGRVVRGGSWSEDPRGVRSAKRSRLAPDRRFDHLGFRVARAPFAP